MLTKKKPLFDRVQLVAGRCGLRLVSSRHRVGARRYFLRHISDVTRVVVVLPDGGLRFVKAIRAGGKKKSATWLSLGAIEQILEGRSSLGGVAAELTPQSGQWTSSAQTSFH